MRLVGKACFQGDIGQRLLTQEAVTGGIEPAQERVAVGAGAKRCPKLASQVVPGEPAHDLQLLRTHHACPLSIKQGPRPRDCHQIQGA